MQHRLPTGLQVPRLPPLCFHQVLALFNKAMRKLYGHLRAAKEAAVERTLPKPSSRPQLTPHAVDVDEELDEAAVAVRAELRAAFQPEALQQYAIKGSTMRCCVWTRHWAPWMAGWEGNTALQRLRAGWGLPRTHY